MVDTPGVPDHAAPEPVVATVGLSPKMIWSTAGTTLVMVVVAVLNAVQTNPGLIGGLPLWAQSLILIVIPPVLVGFASYQAGPGDVTVGGR
jgi:hypothetical protein